MTNTDLILILAFWLFSIIYGCIVCYIAKDFQRSRQRESLKHSGSLHKVKPEPEPIRLLSPVKQPLLLAKPIMVKDFANSEYMNLWLNEFKYAGYWLEHYLETAIDNGFAVKGKECIDYWKSMIKNTKAGSPGSPKYYEHTNLCLRKTGLTDNEVMAWAKPTYQYYSGKGFGCGGFATEPICGEAWIDEHKQKYPDGLPEMTITVTKVKKGISVLKQSDDILKSKRTRKAKESLNAKKQVEDTEAIIDKIRTDRLARMSTV